MGGSTITITRSCTIILVVLVIKLDEQLGVESAAFQLAIVIPKESKSTWDLWIWLKHIAKLHSGKSLLVQKTSLSKGESYYLRQGSLSVFDQWSVNSDQAFHFTILTILWVASDWFINPLEFTFLCQRLIIVGKKDSMWAYSFYLKG